MYCTGSFVSSVLRMTDCALSCPPEPVLSEVEVSGHLLFNEKVPRRAGLLKIQSLSARLYWMFRGRASQHDEDSDEPITASSRWL